MTRGSAVRTSPAEPDFGFHVAPTREENVTVQRENITAAPTYPADLTPELQATLAALADLDLRWEIDREAVLRTIDTAEQALLLDQIDRRRETERGPLVQKLARLQQVMTFALMRRARVPQPEDTISRLEVEVERTDDAWPGALGRSA